MKKVFAMILALVMALSLVACGASQSAPASSEPAAPAESAEPEKVVFTMGIDPEYPPFSYLGDDGEYAGFDVEVCKAACELLGWDFQVFGVNWDEKLIQLDAKECDCIWSGMTILDSMTAEGYVISAPYYDNTQVLLVKEGSDIKSSADLVGKRVAVQLGTSGEAMLADDLADMAAGFSELVTCNSFLTCFTELGGGSVDAVFVDLPVATAYAAENPGFTVINEELGAEQYGIAFRNGDDEMCAAIEGAVQQLVDNGTYAKIAEKYPDVVNNLLFLK